MAIPGATLVLLKARLGITGTDGDAVLNGILCGAERSAVVYLGYDPSSAQVTEYYSGNASEFLVLRRKPVTSVVSVYEDADGRYGESDAPFPAETLLVEGTDYSVKTDGGTQTGILVRHGRFWPYSHRRPVGRLAWELSPEFGSVKCEYVAGYTATQMGDIAEAVLSEAASLYQSRHGLGLPQSESLDGRSLSFSGPTDAGGDGMGQFMNSNAERILRRHRITPWA